MVACVVGMVGAGTEPVTGRSVKAVVASNFDTAFLSITNPVSGPPTSLDLPNSLKGACLRWALHVCWNESVREAMFD